MNGAWNALGAAGLLAAVAGAVHGRAGSRADSSALVEKLRRLGDPARNPNAAEAARARVAADRMAARLARPALEDPEEEDPEELETPGNSAEHVDSKFREGQRKRAWRALPSLSDEDAYALFREWDEVNGWSDEHEARLGAPWGLRHVPGADREQEEMAWRFLREADHLWEHAFEHETEGEDVSVERQNAASLDARAARILGESVVAGVHQKADKPRPGTRFGPKRPALGRGSRATGENFHEQYDPANPSASPAFRRWFHASGVLDLHGGPRVVYHGTYGARVGPRGFDVFSNEHSIGMDRLGPGGWFDSDPGVPNTMAGGGHLPKWGTPAQVVPVYLRIERPKTYHSTPISGKTLRSLDRLRRSKDTDAARDRYQKLVEEEGYIDAHTQMVWDLFPRWGFRLPYTVARIPGSRSWELLRRGEPVGWRRDPIRGTREAMESAAHAKNRELALDQGPPSNEVVAEVRARLMSGDHDGIPYDGICLRNTLADFGWRARVMDNAGDAGSDWWIPFDPGQIKSAIGNRGTFDPGDPRINFNRSRRRK